MPPDIVQVHTPSLDPAVLNDVTRTFELLGVQSFRAAVFAIGSMTPDAQWAIDDTGRFSTGDPGMSRDGSMAGATSVVRMLTDADGEKTIKQQLTPQRWRFAWRLNTGHTAVAEAQFVERRDTVIDLDIAFIRLVFGMGDHAVKHTGASHTQDVPALIAPAGQGPRERRARPRESMSALSSPPPHAVPDTDVVDPPGQRGRRSRVPLALLAATALLTGWIALVAVPQTRDVVTTQLHELGRLRSMAHNTMVSELSIAMVSGDYGQVQSVLSNFASLGYFPGAVVANGRQRIVSLAGKTESLRIGDALPAELLQSAPKYDLKLGSQDHGQLLIVGAPAQAPTLSAPSSSLLWTAWLAFAISAASTMALFAGIRQRRLPRKRPAG